MILSELKTLRWADLFIWSLLDPRALSRQIQRQEPRSFALSFMIPAMAAIADILAVSILSTQTAFFYYKVTYGWILSFLWHAIALLVAAVLMDAASQFFGYRGNAKECITLVNFSQLPKVFILPLVYLFRVIHFAPIFFYVLFTVALAIWSVAVMIQGISEMHGAGLGRSTVIVLFPAILLGGGLFFILVLLMLCGAGYLGA